MVGFPPVTEILGITCNKQISKKIHYVRRILLFGRLLN